MAKYLSYRYNKKGITRGLFLKLLKNNKFSYKYLRLPKPQSDGELELLTEFFFGIKIGLNTLNIPYISDVSCYIKNNKNDFKYKGYFEDNVPFNDYEDYNFSNVSRFSNLCIDEYDVEDIFWSSVLGSRGTGGVAHHCYGEFFIYGYEQSVRFYLWMNNRRKNKNTIRENFRKELDRLIELNKKYEINKRKRSDNTKI